ALVFVMPVLFTTSLMMSSLINGASRVTISGPAKLNDRIRVIRLSSTRSCFYLFVYGTLRSRFTNPYALMLRRSSESAGLGRVRGWLERFKHYSGIHLEATAKKWIVGEIYQLKGLDVLGTLDRYEGSEFERLVTDVIRRDGSSVRCWIY